MRSRRKKFTTTLEILSEGASKYKLKDRIGYYRLWKLWMQLVGKAIAEHARPFRITRRAVIIRVDHPMWIQELTYLKPMLINKMGDKLPELRIEEIRCELGELPPSPLPDGEDPFAVLETPTADVIAFAEQATDRIIDPEVRQIAQKAMIRGLMSRQKK